MFKESRILFLYAETAVHAGSGRAAGGATDLPIQRERVTQYPLVQASGLKGALRADFRERKKLKDEDGLVKEIFGEAGGEDKNYAGAVSVGDARLLLLAVRALKGVFAYVTSAHALSLLRRTVGKKRVRRPSGSRRASSGALSRRPLKFSASPTAWRILSSSSGMPF